MPSQSSRTLSIKGKPGLPLAVAALQGFDLLSNDPAQKDPACEIKQVADCHGAGRYIRTLVARADLLGYDPPTGEATVAFTLQLDNDAPDGLNAFETGTMCVRALGNVALLQLDHQADARFDADAQIDDLRSGQRQELPLGICHKPPPEVPCQ